MKDIELFRWEECRTTENDIPYLVRTEDIPLYGENDQLQATMYSYSYMKLPEDKERPVAFCYNGGPGADSGWLHMGLLGPKTIKFEDFPTLKSSEDITFTNNNNNLLDVCDIVLIDPVGTSFAQTFDDEAKSEYYSTDGDGRAFVQFILRWLEANSRMDCDIYLIGESYGTIRNLAIADYLPEEISLKGIVSIGTSINVGGKTTLLVEPNVRRLGANAAGCWYHYHREEISQEEFIEQAMEFAYGDYAQALLLGDRIDKESFEKVRDRLAYYTGLSAEMLEAQHLRFSEMDYMTGLLPGRIISMYDSRLSSPISTEDLSAINPELGTSSDANSEPFMSIAGVPISECLERYLDTLGKPEGREYRSDTLDIAMSWDFYGYEKDTITLPAELMERRKDLRFLFINGRYDLSSTFDFMTYYLSQFCLPKDRYYVEVYEGGHATYIDNDSANLMTDRIREFIRG